MTETTIYNLPEEVRPEFTERYIVPVKSDGSIVLDSLKFRASQGSETANTNIFVACGNDGTNRLLVSDDGVNWTTKTDPSNSSDWGDAAAWNGSTWVAVGDYTIMTSPDANTWSDISSPIGLNTYDVVWADTLGLFVMCGAAVPMIYTSPDGITWTGRSTPWDSTPGIVNGLAWASDIGTLMALGQDGTGTGPCVMTSTNGTTWTQHSSATLDGGFLNKATWSPSVGLWVAVGNCGTGNVFTSPDTTTWTQRHAGGTTADVCWSPDLSLFLACSQSTWVGGTAIATSPDGITWTGEGTVFGSAGANGCAWSSSLGLFVVQSSSATGLYTSSDGTTWTHISVTGWNGIRIGVSG